MELRTIHYDIMLQVMHTVLYDNGMEFSDVCQFHAILMATIPNLVNRLKVFLKYIGSDIVRALIWITCTLTNLSWITTSINPTHYVKVVPVSVSILRDVKRKGNIYNLK